MEYVYLLEHSYEALDGHDEFKLIGVYSSPETAQAAIRRLETQPGFKDRPEAFQMNRYEIDKDHWEEGYISAKEALESIPD